LSGDSSPDIEPVTTSPLLHVLEARPPSVILNAERLNTASRRGMDEQYTATVKMFYQWPMGQIFARRKA